MSGKTPFRIMGSYNNCPVFMRVYATYIELSCDGKKWYFRSYDEVVAFLRNMPRKKGRERKQYEFKCKP